MNNSTLSTRLEKSAVPDYEDDFVFDDHNQHIIVGIVFLVASALGIFGNSLVIVSVFASRKLRTVTNAFVVNLSIADLITSLIIPWNAVVLFSRAEYPIADEGCAIVAGLLFMCVGCSLFTLASIALSRLLLITKPVGSYTIAPCHLAIWIAATWMLSFLFNIIPLFAGIGELGISQKYRVCAGKSSHPRKDIYDYIQAIGCFPIPLLTLIICYSLIYFHLRRHAWRVLQSGLAMSSFAVSGTLPQNSTIGNTHTGRRYQSNTEITLRRRENAVTKNMFIVFLAYFICNIPFMCTLLIEEIAPAVPYASALILLNACINPILYGFKHPNFKEVFGFLLMCNWRMVPEPSSEFTQLRECYCHGG